LEPEKSSDTETLHDSYIILGSLYNLGDGSTAHYTGGALELREAFVESIVRNITQGLKIDEEVLNMRTRFGIGSELGFAFK